MSSRKLLRAVGLCFALLQGCSLAPPEPDAARQPRLESARPAPAGRPKIALALGSGGTRGFAHIGVIKALEQAGIEADLVVGSSAGAVIGALYAGGARAAELEQLALELNPLVFFDVSLFDGGKAKGHALQEFVNSQLERRPIERLPREFAAVATRASDGAMQVFNRGDAGLAVRASSAMRWRFLPATIRGEDYFDGAEASPVPIRAAKMLGADIVIGVNVNIRLETLGADARWQGFYQRRQGMVDREAREADIMIHPDTGASSGMGDGYRREVIAAAEAATLEQIPRIRAAIASRSRVAAAP